jgi:hypothetical protein
MGPLLTRGSRLDVTFFLFFFFEAMLLSSLRRC